MLNPNIEMLENLISAAVSTRYKEVPPTEEEFLTLAQSMRATLSTLPVTDEEFAEILVRLRASIVIQMDVGVYINDRNTPHKSWLPSRRADLDFFFWNRYKKYLEEIKHITLHFAIFDILYDPETKMTLTELIEEIDQRLSSSMAFDESTLRKKLKEYAEEGIIRMEKDGRKVLYSRAPDTDITALHDVIDFFSEVAPCGVIGSFLQDRQPKHPELFSFKHHYITQAMDSDVMATLFEAIHGHRYITVDNLGKHSNEVRTVRLVPLKLYISAQNGRQNLLAFHEKANRLNSYRLDYMSNIRIEDEICEKFDALRAALSKAEAHMWGVNCRWNVKHTEHVEFEIKIEDDEQFIVRRLEREKRCGCVEKIDDNHYRYVAEVFDTTEMLPWIRTFISRITRMSFSNRTAENKFKADIQEMCRMYGLDGGAAQ